MTKTEIILRENGTLTERTLTERELQAEGDVLALLNEEVTRTQRHVLTVPGWGVAHANVGAHDTLWSVPIQQLPLKARFRLINGVLVPMFASTTDLELPLRWTAPPAVRLVFVVRTEAAESYVTIGGNWLFAFDAQRHGYRLPLPNLYDDCSVCTGDFEDCYDTVQLALAASLQQFERSAWNADLMRTVAQSQKFFRFRPTNDTFETLPIEATDWTTLGNKVATALMERVTL